MKSEEQKQKGREIQIVVFRLGDEEFGVEINQVREIVRMMEITRIPEAPGFMEGVINLRGQVIAVIDLARQFNLEQVTEASKTARIIVVEVRDITVGMLVDEVPEVLRIAEEDIKPTPEVIQSRIKTDYIRGVGKLEDRLIVMLDLSRVLAPQELECAGQIEKGRK